MIRIRRSRRGRAVKSQLSMVRKWGFMDLKWRLMRMRKARLTSRQRQTEASQKRG